MAKLKSDPITKEDISQYIEEYSDFSFEVAVLRSLSSLGFSCEHAGTYEDPITKKTREFDIRARKTLIDDPAFKVRISLSVECKNLRANFPLLVHCMPREISECYLNLVWASAPAHYIPPYENAMCIKIKEDDCPYKKAVPVGKSCDQIGRKTNGELTGNDGDVFEKISQAINAAFDLIKEAHYAADKETEVVTVVVPVLVVPDGRIWDIWYKKTGEIKREPTLVNDVEYYIDKSWLVGDATREFARRYYLSHLEITQISRLNAIIEKHTKLTSISSYEELSTRKLQILKKRI